MEELNQAISELSITTETGRTKMRPTDSELTPEEASLNEAETSTTVSTTPGNALVIHPDKEGRQLDEDCDGPHHGILHEHVLEPVFERIINRPSSSRRDILKDVRNFRLVCKSWRNEVTKLYRRTQAPTVFAWKQVRNPLSKMRTFLEVMRNSDMIPVQSYLVMDDFFSEDTDHELLKEFLLVCGSDMVSLYLDFTGHRAKEFDLTRLANLKLEKLKKLHFVFENSDNMFPSRRNEDDPTNRLVSAFLGLLLNSAEGLEEFKFDFQQGLPLKGPWNVPVRTLFEEVVCQGLSNTVKILHLPSTLLGETSFNTLTAKGLKLEEFHINMCGFDESEPAIRKFLETHTSTMKTLRMIGDVASESVKLVFPNLNELLFLEIKEIPGDIFSFTQTFPKLRRFDCDAWDRELQLAKTISTYFPNITELHISPASDWVDVASHLREVFIHFPNIEQLYISMSLHGHLNFDADSLLTGVCKASCDRIRKESNFARVNLTREQSMPSILNLTRLKKLEMNHEPGRGGFYLTDFAAHFVFLQMDNLKDLTLSMADMSPEYIKRLEGKLNFSWKQRDMSWAPGQPKFQVYKCEYEVQTAPFWY